MLIAICIIAIAGIGIAGRCRDIRSDRRIAYLRGRADECLAWVEAEHGPLPAPSERPSYIKR